jgi:phage terminase small subunit
MGKTIEIDIGNEQISLTERELMFVEHYLSNANRNTAEAARKAGYSAKTARQQGQRLLTNVDIQKYIAFKSKPLLDQLGITQERVLKEFAVIAFTGITEFLDSDYTLKPLSGIDPAKVGAIKDLEKTDTGHKIRLHDKLTALSKLMEILNMADNTKDDPKFNFFNQINNYYGGK